jgi:hypothetical protein
MREAIEATAASFSRKNICLGLAALLLIGDQALQRLSQGSTNWLGSKGPSRCSMIFSAMQVISGSGWGSLIDLKISSGLRTSASERIV